MANGAGSNTESVAQDQLRAFVERLERMHEERKAIGDDIAEIYAEAKGTGFDPKVLKIVLRHRAMNHDERMELEALVDLYEGALGMRAAPAERDEEPHAPARAPAPAHVENTHEFRPGGAPEAHLPPKQEVAGSNPAPVTITRGSGNVFMDLGFTAEEGERIIAERSAGREARASGPDPRETEGA